MYHACVQATYDPNSIAALLQRAPYHVDSLLAMYDLYRHLGENQYAEVCGLRGGKPVSGGVWDGIWLGGWCGLLDKQAGLGPGA